MKLNKHGFWNPIYFFLVLFLVFTTSLLRGQTIYTGPDNGDWLTPSNWSNGLPAIGNEPTIVGSTIVCLNGTVTLNYSVTNFGSIINKGTTTLSGSINSGGALENQGVFTINAGATMTSSGGFTNSGTLNNSGNVNSNSLLTNTTTGIFNNFAIWQQNGAVTNDGILSNKAGTFSCPAALTNNKTVENVSGATWKIDFGGSFTNAIGSSLMNAGQMQNLGTFINNTTVTNSGTFTNNGLHTCNGIFNNENGGRLESAATINLSGRINNKLGATITSSFRFNILANGYVSNMAQFTNADMIDIALGGTYCNETLSILTGQFGSTISNAGYFKIASSSTVTTNGSITNARKFDIYGTYDAMGGGQIINSDSLCNYGLIKNVNIINNSGVWKNFGTTENNSGGVWTNTNKIENNLGALISNFYEIINKPNATIVNNGSFMNGIRLMNEGTVTNNGSFVSMGDVLNKIGSIFTNNDALIVREGSIQNEGTLTNQKTLTNESCSIILNKAGATINNTGLIENKGIVFQRGILTGNAIIETNGYTQGAGSDAPSACLTTLTAGTDIFGEAKVYGQSGFKAGIGINECAGFQYFANDVNRLIYTCPQIGLTLNTRFKIITRTGDSLTCTVPTTVFDNIAPILSNCPANQTLTSSDGINVTATWTAPTATDNCTVASLTANYASGTSFNIGTTNIVYTATDVNGNSATCSFSITVNNGNPCATDVTPPTLTACPANITATTTNTCKAATWTAPTATDNCGTPSVSSTYNSSFCFPIGTTKVIYTATDAKNNKTTCSFTVSVSNACTSLTNNAATEYYIKDTWYSGSSITVTEGSSLTLSANPNGLASYKWTGPNGFSKIGNTSGDVLVSNVITTAQAGIYTVVLKDAAGCTATKTTEVKVTPAFSSTNCGGNKEQLILKGSIDYISIGNTMSQSEDRSNCSKKNSSSQYLSLPVGAVVKAAYLYWSGSGSLDKKIKLNGKKIEADGSQTYYEPAWRMSFYGARANVTDLVTSSGLYTVSELTCDNGGNYCQSNAAYGAWSMVIVYEKAGLAYSTIHINTDNFRLTYPANTYSSTINCIHIPSGCTSNAKMTIIAFEGDKYKGEHLKIGDIYRGDNNFRGQSGPNLDILTFDVSNVVYAGKTSLTYSIQSYLSYTIWGNAIEGLFDYVKVLKYNSSTPTNNLAVSKTIFDVHAKAETNKARIEWVNNTGYKNDYFSIEKMNNATGEFEQLSIQNSLNTHSPEHYVAYDSYPTEGDNFYRVGAIHNDGTTFYSDAQKVVFTNLSTVRIFPNPADDNVSIDLTSYEGRSVGIQIYNAMGKMIMVKQVDKATATPYQITTSEMPVGTYLIRLLPQGKRDMNKQIIIAR